MDIDAVNTSLTQQIEETNGRIDAVNTSLTTKIDSVNTSLTAKIDAVNTSLSAKIDSVDTRLSGKIDKLTEIVLTNQGQYRAMIWVLSVAGTVAALVSITRTLDWI